MNSSLEELGVEGGDQILYGSFSIERNFIYKIMWNENDNENEKIT